MERHGGGKASVAHGVAGADVVVNSAGYRINLEVMRSSLEAGAHYVDLGGLYWMTGQAARAARGLRAGGPARDPRHGLEPRQDERDGGARRARARHREARLRPRRRWRARPGPARRRELPLRAPDADRRADDAADRDPRRRAGRARADASPAERCASRTRSATARRSTRSTRRCARSPRSFGCREASFRLSLAPALLERLRELAAAGDAERARRRGARRAAVREDRVLARRRGERRRAHRARHVLHPAARGMGPRRRHRVHRGARPPRP